MVLRSRKNANARSNLTNSTNLKVKMASLKQLLKDIESCEICKKDLPLGPRPVLRAHSNSKILIAGQAPGTRVHKTGIPFNDPSGDRLRDWMGVDHETFYDQTKFAIIPMGFCYPGKGKSGDLPPRTECAKEWRERLLGKLNKIELTLVIGKYAIDWHINDKQKKNLTKTVQAWREYWPEILPLPHPSPRNNLWLRKNPWFEKDIVGLMRERINKILK